MGAGTVGWISRDRRFCRRSRWRCRPPDYFSYAVPATLLLALGVYLPLWRIGRRPVQRTAPSMPADFVHTCDIMVVVGIGASIIQNTPLPVSLQYLMLLVGYLSFVGAFGLLLARAPGWGWRLAAVLALRAVLTSSDGMFHDLLLWSAYTGTLLGFVYRWRVRTLVVLAHGRAAGDGHAQRD